LLFFEGKIPSKKLAITGGIMIKRPYSLKEEVWSSLIHGVGILLGVAALSVLVSLASIYSNAWAVVSTAIFGSSMILMYTASTLYHAVQNSEIKKKLKKFDHISIYYLIAGSYTPFLLVNLRGTLGWSLFGIVWGLAVVGTFLNFSHKEVAQKSGPSVFI